MNDEQTGNKIDIVQGIENKESVFDPENSIGNKKDDTCMNENEIDSNEIDAILVQLSSERLIEIDEGNEEVLVSKTKKLGKNKGTKEKIVKETKKKKDSKTKEKTSIPKNNNNNKSNEKKVIGKKKTITKVKDMTMKKKVTETIKKVRVRVTTPKPISTTRKERLERDRIEAQQIFENPTCVTTAFLIRKALKHSYGFNTSSTPSTTASTPATTTTTAETTEEVDASTAEEPTLDSTTGSSSNISLCNVHPVVKILDDMKSRNDVSSGWLRINDCISQNKQCPTNVRSFLSNEERELLLKLALILKPIVSQHYQSRLAYAWGISSNSVTNIINRACENGTLSINRKKRWDAGCTIQNSSKKRASIVTPYFLFKKSQRTKYKLENATIKNRYRKKPYTHNELQQMWNDSTSDVKEYYTNLAKTEAQLLLNDNENNNENNNNNSEETKNKPTTVMTISTNTSTINEDTTATASTSTSTTATTNDDNMQDVEDEYESTMMTVAPSKTETTKKLPLHANENENDPIVYNGIMRQHVNESDLLIGDDRQQQSPPKRQLSIRTKFVQVADATESVVGAVASASTSTTGSPASTSTTNKKTESKNSYIDDDAMDVDANNNTTTTTTTSDAVGDISVAESFNDENT